MIRQSTLDDVQALNYIALWYLELMCHEVDPTQTRIDAVEAYLTALQASEREALCQQLLQQCRHRKTIKKQRLRSDDGDD